MSIETKTAKENSSQEEGELSPKKLLDNGHNAETRRGDRHSYSDDSNNSRFLLLACSSNSYVSD